MRFDLLDFIQGALEVDRIKILRLYTIRKKGCFELAVDMLSQRALAREVLYIPKVFPGHRLTPVEQVGLISNDVGVQIFSASPSPGVFGAQFRLVNDAVIDFLEQTLLPEFNGGRQGTVENIQRNVVSLD